MRQSDIPPPERIAQVEGHDRLRISTLLGAALFCVLFWTAVGLVVVEVVL